MTKNDMMEEMTRWLEDKITRANEVIGRFNNEMSGKLPFFALEWADDAFRASASKLICQQLLTSIREGTYLGRLNVPLEHAIKIVESDVMLLAKNLSCSTSPCVNFARECKLGAMVDVLEHHLVLSACVE